MQGVPAHYKMHIKRGTNIERTMAEKLLAEFTGDEQDSQGEGQGGGGGAQEQE